MTHHILQKKHVSLFTSRKNHNLKTQQTKVGTWSYLYSLGRQLLATMFLVLFSDCILSRHVLYE